MISSGMVLEIVYNGRVYDVTVTKTDKTPNLTRPKRRVPPQIIQISTEVCPSCGALTFNSICMNRKCIHSTGSLLQETSKTKRLG